MKVCIVLSGSIRLPERSRISIHHWMGSHEVDVYVHTWRNVRQIHDNHWQLAIADEPTDELLNSFHPKSVAVEDWQEKRLYLRELWPSLENLSSIGMFYSMQQAYQQVPDITAYDVVFRMRFDNTVYGNPFDHSNVGWTIPEGNDFGGVCDRFGWMLPSNDPEETSRWASGYFDTYHRIPTILAEGVDYCPEKLLGRSLEMMGAKVTRVPFNASILGF